MKCPTCGQPIDPMKAQFQRHRYPVLVSEGLGHLWVGPGRNDFADRLVMTTQKFLKKRELPCEKGDAINAIRNKVLVQDWGWLEQRWEEGNPASLGKVVGADSEQEGPKAEDWKPIWEMKDD